MFALINVGDSLPLSILGFLVVFVALILLMFGIRFVTGAIAGKAAGQDDAEPEVFDEPEVSAVKLVPAAGSQGEVKLYDVDHKTAAMIMAIVAEKMDMPLNELRFNSIRTK